MSCIWDDLDVIYIRETMGNCLQRSLILDNITNNKYKGNLVTIIDTDIRDMTDLEEVLFITPDIIQNNIQKKTQKKTRKNS